MPPTRPATERRRRALVFGGGVLLLVALALLTLRGRSERRDMRELRALGDTLEALRVAFDSCRFDLGRDETEFRGFDLRVDSLREAVRGYESGDARGVPVEQYDAYMETFDRYNRSVEEWEARAEALQGQSRQCRGLAERHNLVADSLRVRLEAREGGEAL